MDVCAGVVQVAFRVHGMGSKGMLHRNSLNAFFHPHAAFSQLPFRVINDDAIIAEAIELVDPIENIGATLVREVASKVNGEAGDGTTTTIILAREMIKSGLLAIAYDINTISLKRGMDMTVKELVKILTERSSPVQERDDIKAVISISAKNDDFVGDLITEAMVKTGPDGEFQKLPSSLKKE
ncbi:hypothetical protein Droror1_Dr00018190 [Drosera rotundifolia]